MGEIPDSWREKKRRGPYKKRAKADETPAKRKADKSKKSKKKRKKQKQKG